MYWVSWHVLLSRGVNQSREDFAYISRFAEQGEPSVEASKGTRPRIILDAKAKPRRLQRTLLNPRCLEPVTM